MTPAPVRVPGDANAWNRFWFERTDLSSLGLLRMLFGLALVMKLTRATGLYRLGELSLAFPRRDVWPARELLDGFLLPYPGLQWLPVPSVFWFDRLEEILLGLAVLVTVGLLTRVVVPLTAILLTYLFLTSQWNFQHHLQLSLMVFWILAFCSCGRRYSLDAALRRRPRGPGDGSTLPLRMVQVLVCSIYLFSFLWKCNEGWFSGRIIQILADTGTLRGPVASWMMDLFPHRLLSLSTLATEGFLAFGLLVPATRRPALAAGVLLHLGIDATMAVGSYSYQMIALYVAFIHPQAGATVVLYDGHCGLCRRSRRWTAWLDWLRRVTWLDFNHLRVQALVPALDPDVLTRDMHVIRPDGQILRGFAAWRRLLGSFPLTFLPSMLLYLPPAGWIGDRVYRSVADHRKRQVCEVAGEEPMWCEAAERTLLRAASRLRRAEPGRRPLR